MLGLYLHSALKRANHLEIADLFCALFAALFYPLIACKGAWYFLALIIACDIMRFFVKGAWYYAPFHKTAHHHNPSKDLNAAVLGCIKMSCLILILAVSLLIYFAENIPNFVICIRSWLWYIMVIATIVETFRCLLHTMHKHNNDWLRGSNGHIGVANWISISRIAVSVIMPHIYIAQSFGKNSNRIATTLLVTAIGTDAFDGYIARQTKKVTKVGKYLDPLGDKIIFFPNAVAFIFLLYRESHLTGDNKFMITTIILISIAAARDVLFFIWFFSKGRKLPRGLSANLIDKMRMAGICAWLLAIAIKFSLLDDPISDKMAKVSVIIASIVATLSVISIFVDYKRYIRALRRYSNRQL